VRVIVGNTLLTPFIFSSSVATIHNWVGLHGV